MHENERQDLEIMQIRKGGFRKLRHDVLLGEFLVFSSVQCTNANEFRLITTVMIAFLSEFI
jgi:hypothetical protein